jgi:ABC-type Mn2+/Zn2+ transport system ATPase subunit
VTRTLSKAQDQVLCLNRRLQCIGPPGEILTAEALTRLYGPATTATARVSSDD